MGERSFQRWAMLLLLIAAIAAAWGPSLSPAEAQSSSSWPMYRADPEHSGYSTSPMPTEPAFLWSTPAGTAVLTSPVAAGGRLFAGSTDGNIYALWASTGGEAWHARMGEAVSAEPAVEGSTVYAVSESGRLCALGADDGGILWEAALPSNLTYSLPLTLAADGLYMATPSGTIMKVSTLEKGKVLWQADAGARMKGPVTVGEGRVFAVAEGGKAMAFDAADGARDWAVSQGLSGGEEYASALVDGRLYFGTKGKDVFCLNPLNGSLLWNTSVKSTITGSPAVGRGLMVLGTENGLVVAINTSTGATAWTYDVSARVTISPSMADGFIFLGNDKGGIHMLRASSGQLVWYYKAGGSSISSPAIADGKVLFTTRDGNVLAFGKPEAPRPVARLAVDPQRASVGEVVNLSALGSAGTPAGAVSGYLYDPGDGSTTGWTADPAVSHQYLQKGDFTVSLKVRDANGTESDTTLGRVEVFNYPPVLEIRSPSGIATARTPALFSANASDPDGRIALYGWDFGDGSLPWEGTRLPSDLTHVYQSNGTYIIGFTVTDDNGSTITSVQELKVLPAPARPTPGPGNHPVSVPMPAIAASISLVALGAVGAALSFTEFGKYRLLTIFFVPLYVRLKKDEVLDNYVRGQIHGYIIANPGDHYNSIRDALELSNGILAHHLNTLEREGLVQSMRDGMYKRFFPANAKLPPEDEGHFNIQKRIVHIIRENPGISQKEIAAKVGVSSPTVNYHVSVLATARMIRVDKVGRMTHCYVIDQQPPT